MIATNFIKLDLCRIWLGIFITILHIYLIYSTIRDYLNLKSLSFDPLFGGQWNQGPMGFKLSCLLCSITFLPLIIITSFIVTGNLANDGHILGQDIDNNHFIIDSDSKGQIILVDLNKSKRNQNNVFCSSHHFIKQQFVPISIFLQFISAICYLIPIPFVEALKLENKALPSNFLWHTDLDFLIDTDKHHEDFAKGESFHLPMRPAYFNLIFCLSLLSFRYPSVFWRTSRKFTLLFCFIIAILSLHILFDYSSIEILIRLSVPGYVSADLIPNIHPIILCIISLGGSTILVSLLITVFNYGITQYLYSLCEHRQTLRLQYKSQHNKKSLENDNCSNTSSDSGDIEIIDSFDEHSCLSIYNKYCAHFTAIIFGTLAMGMKTPLFILQWKIFSRTGDRVMYFNIIFAILFSIIWLIMWFGFTLNNDWKFKVYFLSKDDSSAKKRQETSVGGVTCSTLPTTSANILKTTSLLGNTGSPVYATCHPVNTSSMNRVIISPNHQNSNQIHSDETELTNCYNYVLLHSANNTLSGSNSQNPNVSNYASIIRQVNKSRETTYPTFVNIEGNMTNADDLYGSDKSSESNFSRTLTNQEKSRYALVPQEISDGMINRYLANRYYSMEHPSSKRTPLVHSPLLSYQFSTESSPSEHSRRQINNQSKVTFTDQLMSNEPDLLTHKYPAININEINHRLEMNDMNPTLDQMRIEFLGSDGLVKHGFIKDLASSSPISNNDNIIVCENKNKLDKSPTNSNSNEMNETQQIINHNFLMKLNGLNETNDEEERLCSQV